MTGNISLSITTIDEKYEPMIDFILRCKNLEELKLNKLSSNLVNKIFHKIDNLPKLRVFRIVSLDEITLTKEDFCKLKKCVLLEEIALDIDWMKKESDIYMLFEILNNLRFVNYINEIC